MIAFWILKKPKTIAAHHEDDHEAPDGLRRELPEPELPERAAAEELAVAVQDAGDALGVLGRSDTVPFQPAP